MPHFLFVFELINYFEYGAFMLICQCFKTTVFHKIGQIAQLVEITGYPIVVTDSSQFCIVGGNDFQIGESQKGFAMDRHELPSRFLYRNLICKDKLVNLVIKWNG